MLPSGSLFDYVDRHDHHSEGTYPLAHNSVTSFYVSGPVRFPVGIRLYRRYEELTQWEAAVAKHCPELKIPSERKARNRLHTQVDPVLLQDPEFRARHEQFRTKIALAVELIETFYQDSKGQLGFNAYRMRSTEAMGKHWCLVFVAYSLLHLTC